MKKVMKKYYVKPCTSVFSAYEEQSIMALSTVKFHDVENGGQDKDENGVMPSDDPTDDEWDDIGWD